MNLKADMNEFLSWLKSSAMPDFMEYVTDTYHNVDTYSTVAEELESLGSEIKDAVKLNDLKYYTVAKEKYKSLFIEANIKVAKIKFHKFVDDVSTDMPTPKANEVAVQRVWEDPKWAYWLPIYVLLKDGEDNEVCLVSRKEHAPKSKNYVTISELNEIENMGKDPWKFVKERVA